YDSLYISPNGLVSFLNPGMFTAANTPGFPGSLNLPVIAPFWADADLTQSGGSVHMTYGVSPRSTPFIQIDWNDVGYYSRSSVGNLNLRNTFSLYIEDAAAGDIVAFVYDTMQWTTGDSGGSNGFGGFGAEIGFDSGDGVQYYSEMRPNSQQGLASLLAATDSGVLGYRMDPTTGLLAKGEPGLGGVTVYLDYDNDGTLDVNEPWTVTRHDDLGTANVDETGQFEFTGLFGGSYTVREVLEGDWVQTYPDAVLTYLPDAAGNKMQAVAGSDLADGDRFLVSDGTRLVQFEFENTNVGNGTTGGAVAVNFTPAMTAAQVAAAITTAINGQTLDLSAEVKLDVSPSGDVVVLTADTVANPTAVVSINPQTSMLAILGNSRINADRSYTVEVGAGDTYGGILFGNHKLSTISVGDVSVAEGAQGQSTVVNVTFERRGSFGAPLVVRYHTVDGDPPVDGSATVGDNDYQPVTSGSFIFNPQDEPQATWDIKPVTHNRTNDYDYHVAGDSIVFEVADGNDWEIMAYNDTIGGSPLALTVNTTDDRFADVHRVGTGTSGSLYVVWAGVDPASDQTDYEIFFAEVAVTPSGLNLLRKVQLTQNGTDDKSPRVSGSHVTWWGIDTAGDREIYLQKIAKPDEPWDPSQNISNNDYDDFDPVIDGDHVAWHAQVGQGTEIFLYDGTSTRRLTNNQAGNNSPQLAGNYMVWQGRVGTDYEVFLYEIDTRITTQLTSDAYDDVAPKIDGLNVVWQGGPSSNREIYLYNVEDAGAPSNISNSSVLDERPEVNGDQIVWHSFDGYDWEVMFFDLSKPFLPSNVSNNLDYDWGPQISSDLLVWRSNDGVDYEIVVAS
ncbi:MAG: nidogen-like domain-containing protein, partial [Thermoguttaceae bacterium]